MDRSDHAALLAVMESGGVLLIAPFLGGLAATESNFPTGKREVDFFVVAAVLLVATAALLYRGYRYQRRTYTITALDALAAVTREAMWIVIGFTFGPFCLLIAVIAYSTLFVNLAAAAMGIFMTYKGARALWQVRHYVLPSA
jgi:hypothetical protein